MRKPDDNDKGDDVDDYGEADADRSDNTKSDRYEEDDDAVGGQLVSQSELFERLQRALPLDNVIKAIGYGSGVFSQQQQQQPKQQSKEDKKKTRETHLRRRQGNNSNETSSSDDLRDDDDDNNKHRDDHEDDSPLIDLIVVVKDATEFHRQNFIQNPTHYSSLLWPWKQPPGKPTPKREDGAFHNIDAHEYGDDDESAPAAENTSSVVARRAEWIQRHSVPSFLSSVASNPGAYYVVDNHLHRIKYGVIHQRDLLDDVKDWKYLYVAGRMHKPTVTVHDTQESAPIQVAQKLHNVPAALSTALLLMSGTSGDRTTACDERNVYEAIAGLSYAGDFRMTVGAEDPRKLQNLVAGPGSLQRFRQLYKDAASILEQRGLLSIQSTMSSSSSSNNPLTWTWDTSEGSVRALAESLPPRFRAVVLASSGSSATTDPAATGRRLLQRQLQRTVAPAARYQSLKGLVTAGSVQTSIQYALRKLRKGRGR